MAKCPFPSILVGINTPRKNGNWPQQASSMKPSLVSVALWKKNYGVPETCPNNFYRVNTELVKQGVEGQNNTLK